MLATLVCGRTLRLRSFLGRWVATAKQGPNCTYFVRLSGEPRAVCASYRRANEEMPRWHTGLRGSRLITLGPR